MKILAFVVGMLALCGCATPAVAQEAAVSANTVFEIEEFTVVWAKPKGVPLSATIYRPKQSAGRLPALIDVHGGAWGSGDRTSDRYYCAELAKTGLVIVSIDFRQSPDFKHPASSADIASALRFVRLNDEVLKVDPERVGLIGSSSGGHLALLAAVRPDTPEHRGTPILHPDGSYGARGEISAFADYVVAMWPVSDPAARFRYAKRAGLNRLAELTTLYFQNERMMWDASIPRIVTAGEARDLPPILVIQPGDDSNIPQEMTFDLIRAWQARGGKLDYAFYPGQPHAFGHRPSEATTDLIAAIAAFIRRQNAMPRPEPTQPAQR